MKTVQLAVQDLDYADSVRNVLVQDGEHRVHLVKKPDVTLGGVIMVDAPQLNCSPLLAWEQERLVVVVQKERDDLSMVWDAGVRHVVFQDDPPQTARIVVLGLELSLASNGATGPA
jgi:hypothetical protein